MSLPVLREHTDAVLSMLAAEEPDIPVGDAVAPAGKGPPYFVVYPIAGGDRTGTLAAPDDDAFLVYQVTCVGESREQAEWLEDRVFELLQTALAVPGRRVARVSLDMHGGVQRDDVAEPTVFWSAPRFRIISTPA